MRSGSLRTEDIIIENGCRSPIHRLGCSNVQNDLRQFNTDFDAWYLKIENVNNKSEIWPSADGNYSQGFVEWQARAVWVCDCNQQ